MDARALATTLAAGRVSFGAALAVAPGLVGRAWAGRSASAPGPRVITTAMGARDAALGLGLLEALRGGGEPRPWLRAAVLADAADLTATLAARRDIPAISAALVTGIAGGSVALGLYLHRELGKAS